MLASTTRRRRRRCWSLRSRSSSRRIVSVNDPMNNVFVRGLLTVREDDSGRREMVKDEDDVESDVRLDLMSATEYSS